MRLQRPPLVSLPLLLASACTDSALSLYSPDATNKTRRGLEERCFYGETSLGRVPLSRIVHAFTTTEVDERLDVAIAFNRDFVDLSYGQNAVGWQSSKKGKHSFKDLVGSDHTEVVLHDAEGAVAFQMKLDLVSASDAAASGYASMGPLGGDGRMITGSAADVIAFGSSLDDNLNARGHVLLEDSPATNAEYAANDAYPDWNFYVEYRVSLSLAAFGDAGFGRAHMEMVHASPSKLGENTVTVTEEGCPDPGSEGDPFAPCANATCLDGPGEGGEGGESGDGTPDPGDEKDPPSNPPGACTSQVDCGAGELCSAGTCVPGF